MSAITVGGDLVHYEVLGRGGRPVILLHGWLGSWRYWIPTMRLLQLKFRVYAVDLFGYGDSSKNPANYVLRSQVHLLDEFMKQLGVPKAAFIGHGLGAQVMSEFATLHEDRVARMLIIGAPLFDVPDLDGREPDPQRRVMLANAVPAEAPSEPRKPLADKATIDRDAVQNSAESVEAPTIPSASNATISNPSMIDREKLRQAAVARGVPITRREQLIESSEESSTIRKGRNELLEALSGGMEALLLKCFKRSDPEFEKLFADVSRTDDEVLRLTARGFDAGKLLDKLRLLQTPMVIVHGEDDPLIKAPSEAVWNYLTESKEDKLLPVPLPGVRHFPMLEAETFPRLVSQFLETPDIGAIEIKERWRRRAR